MKVIAISCLIFLISTFSSCSWADELKKLDSPTAKPSEEISRPNADYLIYGTYAPLDLLLPNKLGLTIGMINSAQKTWELEYLHGSVSVPFLVEDLGKFEDDRISLIGRSFGTRNSFNISYGISYYDFSLRLGSKVLNNVTGGNYPGIDLVRVQTLGLNVGIGNRWNFSHNMSFGVDWISWSQPLHVFKKDAGYLQYATNVKDKEDVEKLIDFVSYFPRLSLFKLQFGFIF